MQRGAQASWLYLTQSHALGQRQQPQGLAAPDALAHSHQRSLRDSRAGTQDITPVATPQAFREAMALSVANIEITDHLDLKDLPVQQLTAAAGVKSIRVRFSLQPCIPIDAATAMRAHPIDAMRARLSSGSQHSYFAVLRDGLRFNFNFALS